MLGDPARYRFVAARSSHRCDGGDVIDADPVVARGTSSACRRCRRLCSGPTAMGSRARPDWLCETIVAKALSPKVAARRDPGQRRPGDRAGADAADALGLGAVRGDRDDVESAGRQGALRDAQGRGERRRRDSKRRCRRRRVSRRRRRRESRCALTRWSAEFDRREWLPCSRSADADALLAALAISRISCRKQLAGAGVRDRRAGLPTRRTRDARAADARCRAAGRARRQTGSGARRQCRSLEGQAAPTDAQRVQHAIDAVKRLFGKDFPVLAALRSRSVRGGVRRVARRPGRTHDRRPGASTAG